MKAWRSQYPVTVMAKVFDVSRSGFHAWLKLLRQKLLQRHIALGLVAVMAGDGEITYSIAAAFGTGMNMVDFEWCVFRPAIDTFPAPFLQQILPDLVSGQGALLVLGPGDFRILHGLGIKPHQLLRQRRHRRPSHQLIDPCQHRIHPMFEVP